jgi:hypothetical protein
MEEPEQTVETTAAAEEPSEEAEATTEPQATVEETTVPTEAVTEPVETEPAETVPEETAAQETVPEETEAEETVPEETVVYATKEVHTFVPGDALPDSDELLAGYLEQKVYGDQMAMFGTAAGARLYGNEKLVYDALVPILKQIASGQRASATIALGTPITAYFEGIGYKQGLAIGTQTDKTKWWLFALCTGIPQLTGILAVIPKFLYPLSGKLREQMYSELMQRRHELSEQITKESNEIKISIEV